MKRNFRSFVLFLCLLTLILSIPSSIFAKTVSEDNLKVKFNVDKIQDGEDELKGEIIITNVGVRSIKDISIENIIPEGIRVEDKSSLVREIGSLKAGESITYEFHSKVESLKPVIDGDINDSSPDNSTDDAGKVDDNIDNNIGSDTSSGVDTGDDSMILRWILLAVFCLSLIIILTRENIRNIFSRKTVKKVLSVFLCLMILVSFFNNPIMVRADENQKEEISIKKDLIINESTYTFETIVTYNTDKDHVVPSGDKVTRGEWVSRLINSINTENSPQVENDDLRNIFKDIDKHTYEEDILYGIIYSIVDTESDNFRPDEPASREFAATTAVRALNIEPVKAIVCDDSGDIGNLKEVEAAVAMDIINLENNKFYPLRSLRASEADYMLEGIGAIIKSTEIDPNYDSTIEYKEGVVEFEKDSTYEVRGSEVSFEVNEESKNLKKDDVFILSNQRPYKVVSVRLEGNKVIVDTVEPEIEEALDYIDAQGQASIDMEGFIPTDGVEVIESKNPRLRRINIDEEGSIGNSKKVSLGINKEINGIEFSGEIDFNLSKVLYKADVDVGLLNTDVNNVYLKFPVETSGTGKISVTSDGDMGGKKDGTLTLGKVPIAGVPGITVVAEIGLAYTAEGQISLVYSVGGDLGAQVLNNRLIAIKDISSTATPLQLEASAKMGPKVSGLLEVCSYWNLIDFSAFAGGAIDGSATVRDTGMVCLDGNLYLFGEITALDDCLIRDWLNLSLTYTIWDKDNSPLLKNMHFEDFEKAPECTYGQADPSKGIIKGTVAEAGNRTKFIKDALIGVYDTTNNKLIKKVNSDVSGRYNIELSPGTYTLKISKDGYIAFESIETLGGDEEKYIETLLMVGQGEEGEEGSAGGNITNSLTGQSISDLTIRVRKGWNNSIGDVLSTTATDPYGKYQVKLPLGNYTVEMVKEGYLTKTYNIYVASGSSLNQNSTILPDEDSTSTSDMRIVLTWGENPRDLDSHLVGPSADGNHYFHTYYRNKKYIENSIKYADLDLDDTSSYGPETTSIYKMNDKGKYSFYVHDYSNGGNNDSVEMSNSGAKVEVYKGNTLHASYNIPTNEPGTYWHVFDYDAENDKVVPVNKFIDGIVYPDTNKRSLSEPSQWQVEEK